MENYSSVAFVFLIITIASISGLNLCSGNEEVVCKESERQALLRFKQDLKDPMNRLSSWDDAEAECCSWTGVACHNITGHVLHLHLGCTYDYDFNSIYSFRGKLNPSLLSLKYLNYLDLSWNDFEGIQIPSFIGSLKSLTYLDLSHAGFGGIIPHQLGNLSNLRYLDLHDSSMEAENFQFIGGLSSLQYLNMSGVSLRNASDWLQMLNVLPSLVELRLEACNIANFPADLPVINLTSLRILDLSYNSNLGPSMPRWIFNLNNLDSLYLQSTSLEGSIAFGLTNMTSRLKILDLSFNQLNSTIPHWMCGFNRLEWLYLYENFLVGYIPSAIGNLTSIRVLELNGNELEGEIPNSLGNLCRLEELDLYDNKLNGSLPESFGQLVKLEELDISHNSFKGVVSEVHFSNLTRLKRLEAYGNSLTLKTIPNWLPPFQLDIMNLNYWHLGPKLPVWIRWQQHLSELHISNAGISDTIPAWFCNIFSQLVYLNLSNNLFHGEFPCAFYNNLSNVDLSSNQLNGSLPLLSSKIEIVDFSSNSFSGSVFHFFCNKIDNLQLPMESYIINLGNNLLSGVIPKCWKKWKNLSVLSLRDNNLDGVVPSSMRYLTDLVSLRLSNNNLSGELPLSLRRCTKMHTLDISENKFVGRIPKWIGASLLELKILNLRSNKFEGDIPLQLCHLKDVQILDMAHNNISGTIPKCFYNLSAMTTLGNPDDGTSMSYFGIILGNSVADVVSEDAKLVMKGREVSYSSTLNLVRLIDLSDNNIHGDIPVELTTLLHLQTLNLSNNHLTGKIPSKIGDMKDLESLDLSRNQIHGEIPPSISILTFLSDLDLSYNNLRGQIPTGTQLQSFSESSFIGNQLCGPPLKRSCSVTHENIPNGGKQGGQGHSVSEENYLYLSLGLGFAFGFWGLLGPLFFKTQWSIAFCGFLDRIVVKLYAVLSENF